MAYVLVASLAVGETTIGFTPSKGWISELYMPSKVLARPSITLQKIHERTKLLSSQVGVVVAPANARGAGFVLLKPSVQAVLTAPLSEPHGLAAPVSLAYAALKHAVRFADWPT
jgi:hypothetical protein